MSDYNNPHFWNKIWHKGHWVGQDGLRTFRYGLEGQQFEMTCLLMVRQSFRDENHIHNSHDTHIFNLPCMFRFEITFDYYTEVYNGGNSASLRLKDRAINSKMSLIGNTDISEVDHHLVMLAFMLSDV